MFYVTYVRNELVRRRARTIVTLLGLGVGVALVIAIASLSDGLDRAQKQTLDPLAGIGTDITVTLTPQQDQSTGFGGPGGGTRRQPGSRAGEPVGDHRPVATREAGRALRARLLPAGITADVQAVRGEPDHEDRRRRAGRGGPDAARTASGGRRPEDRREAEDRRSDLRDPAQPAAPDRCAVPEDAGLHRQAARAERRLRCERRRPRRRWRRVRRRRWRQRRPGTRGVRRSACRRACSGSARSSRRRSRR